MRKKIYVSQFSDPLLQVNFQTIGDVFNNNPFLKGEWVFRELLIPATGTGLLIPHWLNYSPKDVILLSQVGGTVSFNYNGFNATYINLDATVVTSPMTIRILLGRYSEDTVNV